MQTVKPMEIGVMFWAGRAPAATLAELTALGVRCGQMGVPGDYVLAGEAEKWKLSLAAAGFTVEEVRRLEYDWKSEFDSPPKWMKAPYPWDWLFLARANGRPHR